jgi:hypothetical protein
MEKGEHGKEVRKNNLGKTETCSDARMVTDFHRSRNIKDSEDKIE